MVRYLARACPRCNAHVGIIIASEPLKTRQISLRLRKLIWPLKIQEQLTKFALSDGEDVLSIHPVTKISCESYSSSRTPALFHNLPNFPAVYPHQVQNELMVIDTR